MEMLDIAVLQLLVVPMGFSIQVVKGLLLLLSLAESGNLVLDLRLP